MRNINVWTYNTCIAHYKRNCRENDGEAIGLKVLNNDKIQRIGKRIRKS